MITAPRRTGFSLIELLVVIGIIGTLASMLLPAVGLVRASAQKLACQANLQQIHAGIQGYSCDWRGSTMYAYNNSGSLWWSWGDTLATHLELTAPVGAKAKQFGIFNCPMNTKQRYRCDMWGPNAAAQAAGLWEDHSSYSGNGDTFGTSNPSRYFPIRISAVLRPTEMMAVWDGIIARTECHTNDGASTVPFTPNSVRGVRYAHRGRTNILYADGHQGTTTLLLYRSASTAAWNSFYN